MEKVSKKNLYDSSKDGWYNIRCDLEIEVIKKGLTVESMMNYLRKWNIADNSDKLLESFICRGLLRNDVFITFRNRQRKVQPQDQAYWPMISCAGIEYFRNMLQNIDLRYYN